ncbi:alpha/beta fold hydrolase [Bacillus sp. S/N-304-OC-R1]|uniref:alpha/beta fold hydrolase n=1 Tax=Bacillus sp. S/N-304-OC-R1 TaxID=2758034 RepID=UPI001C8E7840|nr:alpha/beta hydrolase [Bacillus sp. S/N-304-OC-R1]MBY0121769.1 alpha/beta hydrolase [Bacillus sp. S/N-304-OC-R1]
MSNLTFPIEATRELYYQKYDESLKQWNIEIESLYINTTFGKTHVIACGPKNAQPLVLLHGMTVSSAMWFANAPGWSEMYRVYAIDTIGDFGKSECVQPITTSEEMKTWLNEVLDALKLDQIYLVGHSMGGWISLKFSLESEKVKKLVLLAPVMSFSSLNWKFPFKLLPAMILKNSYFIRSLYNWMFAKQSRPNSILYEQFLLGYKYGKIQLRVAPTVFKETELKKLQPETLVLIGENEVVYSSVEKALKNAEASPKITAKLIPSSSHCLPAEQNQLVNQLVINFLDEMKK